MESLENKKRLMITELCVWQTEQSEDPKERYSSVKAVERFAGVWDNKETFEQVALQALADKYDTEDVTPGQDLPSGLSATREYFDQDIIDDYLTGQLTADEIWDMPASFEIVLPTATIMDESKDGNRIQFRLGEAATKMKDYTFWVDREGEDCQWRPYTSRTVALRFWDEKPIRMQHRNPETNQLEFKSVGAKFMKEIEPYLHKRVRESVKQYRREVAARKAAGMEL